MTAAPAQRLGLRQRGLLRDGYKADIVIFDPLTVDARATPETPREYPVGIAYVIVNGRLVIDGGDPHRRAAGPRAATRVGLGARSAGTPYVTVNVATLACGEVGAPEVAEEQVGPGRHFERELTSHIAVLQARLVRPRTRRDRTRRPAVRL